MHKNLGSRVQKQIVPGTTRPKGSSPQKHQTHSSQEKLSKEKTKLGTVVALGGKSQAAAADGAACQGYCDQFSEKSGFEKS